MIPTVSFIPAPYRVLALAIGAALALAAAAAGGWFVNGWRLDGAHQRALAEKDKQYGELKDKVIEQNAKIADLNAATRAADDMRKQAQEHAKSVTKRIADRSAAVAASQATNCDGVLREAWENWQ